jgi:hypothetical protein
LAGAVWRVLKTETLREGDQFRLCAVGTRRVPKSWDPRTPVRAVCSSHISRHEAPHPEHECGLYGLRSRARVEGLLDGWKDTQGKPDAWALGRVSLWGRVIEFELGWRAEYAYPYALTVFAADDRIADELRRSYAVDVELAAPLEVRQADEGEEEPEDNGVALLKEARATLQALREVKALYGQPAESSLDYCYLNYDDSQLFRALAITVREHKAAVLAADVAPTLIRLGFYNGNPEAELASWKFSELAADLHRLVYRGSVLQFKRSGRPSLWALRSSGKRVLKTVTAAGYAPAVDRHGECDLAALRSLGRLVGASTDRFVDARDVLAAIPDSDPQKPPHVHRLAQSLLRNEWRRLVNSRPSPRRGYTKQWGLTSAGVAAAETPIPRNQD